MLSINIYWRFALIAISLISAIVLTVLVSFWYALPLYIAGIVLLVGYVLLGTVQSAATIMQQEDFDGAEKRLNLTWQPKYLYASNRAYYYMIKGSIALKRKDIEEGEKYLKMAQEIEVPTDNEKAMLELQLANIHASKGKWKQAQIHYKNAKQLDITQEMIKEQLAQFERVMQSRGQAKAAARMGPKGGAMRPGGKRRRPKMR